MPYIYQQLTENSTKAVIVLPEIFGLNNFIKSTTEKFVNEFGYNAFALDIFYPLLKESKVFDYKNDMDKAHEMMSKLSGEEFMKFYNSCIESIFKVKPEIDELIVCGFCFGGKLSYLAGTHPKVSKVFSFYGSKSVQKDFYEDMSAVETLASVRIDAGDDLKVFAFYGDKDGSIPEEDREEIKGIFNNAHIYYKEHVFDAGHAFMNYERADMYNQKASQEAWRILEENLK